MSNNKIAILGSSSHIAKGLIYNFLNLKKFTLYLFTRSSIKIKNFLNLIDMFSKDKILIQEGYQNFYNHDYDVIINCIGIGSPSKLANNLSDWFIVTEKYDNLVLEYLNKNPYTRYINFSSGAVYGNYNSVPFEEHSFYNIQVNHLSTADYYSIANLNTEAKHRSFTGLKVIDLRIFSYFSRFLDLNSGYLIAEILNCVKNKNIFYTNGKNIVRDYIHPNDLFKLILVCINKKNLNSVFDVTSLAPIKKKQLLDYFSENYGLKYIIQNSLEFSNPNDTQNVYYSRYNQYKSIGFTPDYSSLDTIITESKFILDRKQSQHQNCEKDRSF